MYIISPILDGIGKYHKYCHTILLILMNSSDEVAHGGNSTLPTEVPSS